ncbi:MAG: hypothetical protein K6F98_07865 [Bacteroidales bacterium]|nr:hypothetical protein [Bacteroidales bacterium]
MCNFTTIIEGKSFVDGNSRALAPYKGWFIVGEKGNVIPDVHTREDQGPLTIITDPISHGNWHTLYNLIGKDRKKILVKGVRSIEYFRDGYYLLRDNNEDELINRGDVERCFCACDYEERANIVFDDGRLLSREWYDEIKPAVNGFFLVIRDGKRNLASFNGDLLLDQFENGLTYLYDDKAFSYSEGILYLITSDAKSIAKHLKPIELTGRYYVGHYYYDTEQDPSKNLLRQVLSQTKSHTIIIMDDESGKKTVLTKDGFFLFSNWYDDVRYSGVIGQFLIKNEAGWTVLDMSENKVMDGSFNSVYPFCGNYLVTYQNSCYSIVGSAQNLTNDCFDSVMWADREVWGMNILYQGNKKSYSAGQGDPIINYAHSVLTSNKNLILFGKNGVWYLYDGVSKPAAFFYYLPNESWN